MPQQPKNSDILIRMIHTKSDKKVKVCTITDDTNDNVSYLRTGDHITNGNLLSTFS